MTFTETEQESIVLNAAWSMIDDMVNFAIFMPLHGEVENINLLPQSTDTRRLFHVLLGDFLSPLIRKGRGSSLPFDLPTPPDQNANKSDLTFLFYLRRICQQPRLNAVSDSILKPVKAFATWLEDDTYIEDVWLPSIDVQVSLSIKRITWLKICADIGKHNFARLETNVGKIVRILKVHGHSIDDGMGYAVLPEFWDWFHTNLFAYHASTIAEFLNEIRWGIFEYLRSEYVRAYHVTSYVEELPMYAFHVPTDIKAPIARTMYWDLMNKVRSKPYFPRFTVRPSLKTQF